MHHTMNKVGVCVLVFIGVFMLRTNAISVRYKRSESIDFDNLSDDDVFALLDKPDDYEFQTEKDIEFNFDQIGEEDGQGITAQFVTLQSSTTLSTDELSVTDTESQNLPSVTTSTPEVVSSSALSSSSVSEFPSTALSTDEPSVTDTESQNLPSVTTLTPEVVSSSALSSSSVSEFPSTALSTDEPSVTDTESQNLPSVTTLTPEVVSSSALSSSSVSEFPSTALSTDEPSVSDTENQNLPSVTTLTPEVVSSSAPSSSPVSEFLSTAHGGKVATKFVTTQSSIALSTDEPSVSDTESQNPPSVTTLTPEVVSSSAPSSSPVSEFLSTEQPTESSTRSPYYSTSDYTLVEKVDPNTSPSPLISTETSLIDMKGASTLVLNTDNAESSSTAKNSDSTESTVSHPTTKLANESSRRPSNKFIGTTLAITGIPSTSFKPISTSAQEVKISTTTSTHKTLVELSSERLVASAAVTPKTTIPTVSTGKLTRKPTQPTRKTTHATRKTTRKPTKSVKKTTLAPKRKSTRKPAPKATSKKPVTTTSVPTKMTSTEKTSTSSTTSPSSNTTNTEPICFKLLKPDKTLSNECFFPVGMYPVEKHTSSPIATLTRVFSTSTMRTTTTPSTTVGTTTKPTTKRAKGGICFMRVNSDNKSECFYLDPFVNPSEAPKVQTIATLAPHLMFEITEEPPPFPVELSLLKPPVLNKQKPVDAGLGASTFAPDRIFEIPLSSGELNHNTRRLHVSPAADSVPRKLFIGADGIRNNLDNINRLGSVDLRRVTPVTYGRSEWNHQDSVKSSPVQAGRRTLIRLNPAIQPDSSRKTMGSKGQGRENLNADGQRSLDSSSSQSGYPGRPQDVPWHVRGTAYFPAVDNRRPSEQTSPGNGHVVIIPTNGRRMQYPTGTLDGSSPNRTPVMMMPVNPSFNQEASVSNVRINPRPPHYGNNPNEKNYRPQQVFLTPAERPMEPGMSNIRVQFPPQGSFPQSAQDRTQQVFLVPVGRQPVEAGNPQETHRTQQGRLVPVRGQPSNTRVQLPSQSSYPQQLHPNTNVEHLRGSYPNRPILLVPVNPDLNGEAPVSNVRVNMRLPQGVMTPQLHGDSHRTQQAFMVPVGRSGEEGVSNIRVQVPLHGTFSQNAFVSRSDPQRSDFDHLYLDIQKGRQYDGRPRIRRAPEGNPIDKPDDISLAFVVDTTFSMNAELREVKQFISIIMDEVLNNRGSHILNFIFVPIHDEKPMHENYLVTRDRNLMAQTISNIKVDGGDDCAENSLVGLLKAIELAEKDSHIFLFTDAYAKDYYLVPQIIKLIQRKKPRVYFLLTGECSFANGGDSQRLAFEKIAAASTGIVVRLALFKTRATADLLQKELHAVLEAVAREFEKNRRIVTEHVGVATGQNPEDIKISVEPGLTNLSLTSTGRNTKIDVMGPRGRPKDIVQVLNMPNIQIVSVPKPDPGEWTVSVTSPESPFKFVASGISTTDFVYGFSVKPTSDMYRLSKHPMQGVKSHLVLVPKDPSVLFNISNVELVVDNLVFTTLPITEISKERGIYSGGPILFPDESFKIRINAFTKEGYPLTRLTKATIVPQMPGPPEIDCKKRMIATAGVPFNMTCSVESFIKMDIKMYKDTGEYVQSHTFSHTSTVVLHFDLLKKKDQGDYIIHAKNSAGAANQHIYLEVQVTPPTVHLKPEMVSYPWKRLVIKCDVTSNVDYSVRWMKKIGSCVLNGRAGTSNLLESAHLRIDRDRVVIDPVQPDDEGCYICKVNNEGGEKSAYSHLTIQEPPSVYIDTYEEYFQEGDHISIVCRTQKGVPAVSLSWYDYYGVAIEPGSDTVPNKRVSQQGDSLELLIDRANSKDAGQYTCLGYNPAGRDSKVAVLQYVEAPKVEVRETRVQALRGERLTLECSASGQPTPNITWSRIPAGSIRRVLVKSNRKDSPGKYLEIEAVDLEDSGTYICSATNPGGSDESSIEVEIGEKPHIHRLNKEHRVDIYHTAELNCGASGVPDPIITWFRVRPDGMFIMEPNIDGVLRIDNTQLENGGQYVCSAQNPFGKAESSTALVVLGAVGPRLSKTGEVEVVKSLASRTVILTCPVIESVPPPTIKWFLQQQPVQDFPEMIISKEDGTLTITNFHSDLSGNYTCVAENPVGNDTKTISLRLFDAPVIEALAPTTSAVEGELFSIVCEASGDPPPEITWRKQNGRLLSETKDLVIERVQLSDAGKYVCRARNVAGIDQTDFNLKILTLPKITKWDEFKYVKEGEIVRLNCDAKGNPPPKISWLKNNETIRRMSNEYFRFEASINAAGMYSCIANNDVGITRVDTNVIVHVTPQIQDIAELAEVVAGDPADLKCSATGNPYPSLSWQFRGETLVKQDVGNYSAILHIQHVSESDAGTYFCLANSSVGFDRRNTTLKVLQPPKVKCSDAIYRVVPNERTEIHCDVSANPPASIIWYKEGRRFGLVKDDGSLEFIAQPEDSGPLKMVAVNKAGVAEQIVNLVVLKPPSFLSPSTSIEAFVGTNVSLPCVAQGDPKPDVTWEQYNYPVPSDKSAFNPASGELHILNVELDDDGAYVCTAKNIVGYSSHTVHLNVLSRPKAQIKSWDLTDGVIKEGRELTLICDVSGRPTPGVTWSKDGFPITDSDFIQSPNKLKFLVTSQSTGLYACTALNTVGQESSSIYVNVTTKPSIDHVEDQFLTEREGRSLEMECVVHGNPYPTVTWLKDGAALKVFPDFRLDADKLVISNLSTSMEGTFTCVASNYLGVEEKLFRVTVNSVPVITTNVPEAIELYQFDDYALPCKADGKPTPGVYWKIMGDQYNPGSRSDGGKFSVHYDGTLFIKNITLEDVGKYVCFAENIEGKISKSHEIKVIVPSDVDPSMEIATVQERASKPILCPYENGVWLKNGKPLDTRNARGDDPHYSLKRGGKVLLISDASDTDFAIFSCEAPDGSRHDFNVKVLSRPALYQMPIGEEEYSVGNGKPISVNCSAKGYPTPRVSWLRADPTFGWIPFTNYTIDGVRFEGVHNEVLSISAARLIHNGTYRCISRNNQGKDGRIFSIMWSGPPQIKGEPKVTKKIPVNQPLELSCEMQGAYDISYSWEFLKSGSQDKQVPAILHGLEKTLIVNRVTSEHGGQYTCVASNAAGSEIQTFDVHVIEPPELTRTSVTSLTYKSLEEIELNCTSRGSGEEVYWMKDGGFLIKSDRIAIKSIRNPNGTTTHNLRLANASRADSGTYKCIVSNIAGENQQLFNVRVIVPPQVIPANSNVEVELGRPLTFNCSVTRESESQVAWMKDGRPLGEDKILDDEVVIESTTPDDGGEYLCTVTFYGGVISVERLVRILVPPRILGPSDPSGPDLILRAGDRLELSCIAEGNPQPTLSWSMNGRNLTNGTTDDFWVSADGSKMIKENVTEDDTGAYSCLAASKIVPASQRYYYVLVYDTVEDHFPNGTYRNSTVQYSGSINLECPLSEFTKEVSWYKNNVRLVENSLVNIQTMPDLMTMKISDSSPDNGGLYICRIEGDFPVKVYTFSVVVIVPVQWSNWTEWTACSQICGFGEQSRFRSCEPPPMQIPQNSKQFVRFQNDSCFGLAEERRQCQNSPCPIDGGLSEWSSWDECSASCGKGVQRRSRRCDNPAPSAGGRTCTEPLIDEKECSSQPCVVHGGWSEWSEWSSCSASCGYSVKYRGRLCNNPPPSQGGNYCEGTERRQEEICDKPSCPGEGIWSEWSAWSTCSKTCGPNGFKRRARICLNKLCDQFDRNTERKPCIVGKDVRPCPKSWLPRRPRTVELLVNGILNRHLVDLKVLVVAHQNGSIALNSKNLLKNEDAWFPYVHFLVPPIMWSTAEEVGDSYNGYTLTQGKFKHVARYSFSTGENLKVESIGKGMRLRDRKLSISVKVSGYIPKATSNDVVIISPYEDILVQRGDNVLNSSSRGEILLNGSPIEYTWNSTIDINRPQKINIMYPVEHMKTDNIVVKYDYATDSIRYSSSSAVSYKMRENGCPEGFTPDSARHHCEDIDECKEGPKCFYNQVCKNTMGSFDCLCPAGLVWDSTINMCHALQ